MNTAIGVCCGVDRLRVSPSPELSTLSVLDSLASTCKLLFRRTYSGQAHPDHLLHPGPHASMYSSCMSVVVLLESDADEWLL